MRIASPLRLHAALLAGLVLASCSGSGSAPAPARGDRLWIEEGVGLYVDAPDALVREALVVPAASWLDADLEPLRASAALVFYDPRGRGRSTALESGIPARLEDDVRDLELLRLQLGLERMALLGWSRHGAICLQYALRYPERVSRLVLIAPIPPRRDPWWARFLERFQQRMDPGAFGELEELRASGLAESDPLAFCRAHTRLVVRSFTSEPGAYERMQSDPCRPPNLNPDVSASLNQEIVANLGAWDWRDALEDLEVPVLVLHGSEDPVPIESSEEYVEHLPEGRLVPIEGSGHMPWIERPTAFFSAVESFLAE